MTYGENGSVIGPQNLPTSSAASGIWSMGEIAEAQRDGVWPSPSSGYILLYGDPDNAGGVSAETYPYNIVKLSNGTTVRIGGRFGTSASNSSRLASGEIDLSGGAAVAPTTVANQLAWNWAKTGTTYTTITNQPGSMWVDGSDNLYQCGRTYDASYGYGNSMFVKYNSSQVNQWYQSWKSLPQGGTTYPYGAQQPQIIKTAGTNSRVVGMMNVSTYRTSSYKGRIQIQPMDDSNGTPTAGSKMVYPSNDTTYTSQMNGQPFFSKNVYNDFFATTMPMYDSTGSQMPAIMLWEAESANLQNQFGFNVAALRNQSTGASGYGSTYGGQCAIDSSNNIYVVCYGDSSKASGQTGTNALTNIIIAKYNSSGALQWAYALRQQTGGALLGQGSNMYGGGIICDGTDLYVTGYSTSEDGVQSNNYNQAPFIARIDNSGATPSLTWINQACNPDYSCYAQSVERVGTDQVVSFGYGQTDPSSNVVGVMCSMNIDGTTIGTGDVDGISWEIHDISSYIIFQDATAGTENVLFSNFNSAAGNVLTASSSPMEASNTGTISNFATGAPSVTLAVESGGI